MIDWKKHAKAYDILAVDDEQVIIDSVKKLSAFEDWKVDTAKQAEDALDKVRSNTYRLIICDIMMPEIDGFQFLDELKKHHHAIPVIMTTGYSTVENAVKSLTKGAIDFLPKPFTVDELISTVIRGLKFGQLEFGHAGHSSTEIVVPCPSGHYHLGYSSWSKLDDDGSVRIGCTDLFLKTLDSIDHVHLWDLESDIIQGNTCAHIDSEDEISHNLLAPVTGRIIERNENLIDNIELIEKDPYFEGWLYRVIPSNLDYEYKYLSPCND
ncbi:MAG: response regulator [Caldithrix sp.]|nr:response regulator [Caldithrix sp.]